MNSLINLLNAAKRASMHARAACAQVAQKNGYQPSPAPVLGCSLLPLSHSINGSYQGWFKSTR